jgi:hypothetical protein
MRPVLLVLAAPSLLTLSAAAQPSTAPALREISLNVPSGAPLRLYLTGRLSKKIGAPAQAKLMEPVFAFDREVLPAGTVALGKVTHTRPVRKWERLRAILNGDFTPLRTAEVEFTTLRLPDGHELSAHTVETVGLHTIYIEPRKGQKSHAPQPQKQNNGVLGTAKQGATQIVSGRLHGALDRAGAYRDIVRSPNKKEKLVDFLWSKAPYHPQYWRRGTRFDAPLRDPMSFGLAAVKPEEIASLGTQPAADTVAQVRLLTGLNSATSKQGDRVQAIVTAPLFSSDHKLVLPAGTQLTGDVVLAKKARRFHRAGQLRFNFQTVDLPAEAANLRPAASDRAPMKTQAALAAAEGSGPAPIRVDSEGGVKAKESNTRFLAPVISLMLANKAADNDAGRNHTTSAGADGNVSGRTLGGGLGFGMVGAAISQTSPYVGMAFGYYGFAWSVYSSVVGRGGEVQFDKNAMMEIRFGARTPGNKFLASTTH